MTIVKVIAITPTGGMCIHVILSGEVPFYDTPKEVRKRISEDIADKLVSWYEPCCESLREIHGPEWDHIN